MQKQIYKIDADGFIKEIYVGNFNEQGELFAPEGDFITTELPQPLLFYKPKWNGTEWIEGESDEEKAEREALERLNDLQPSPEELDEAKTEIKILTLLSELEMI